MFGKVPVVVVAFLILWRSNEVTSHKEWRQAMTYPSSNVGKAQLFQLPNMMFLNTEHENDKGSESFRSVSTPEERLMAELRLTKEKHGGASSTVSKRRKGPTLSVVNPLEVLRQRLMLDLARRRIQENQHQINANAEYLEYIGKRSAVYPLNDHKKGKGI